MMKILLQLINKFVKFISLPARLKVLIFESFVLTGITRFAVLFLSFEKLIARIAIYKEESEWEIAEKEKELSEEVKWAISVVSKRTPWESKCLVKALTALLILKKRRVRTTLYLGVSKNENNKLEAHAWLRSGNAIITGGNERFMYKEVAKFASIISD